MRVITLNVRIGLDDVGKLSIMHPPVTVRMMNDRPPKREGVRGEKVFVERSLPRREVSRRDSLRGKNNRGEKGFVERLSPGRNLAQLKR
jgi:hypothetical protein